MENNLISIIIPVYNRTDELRRLLNALMKQTCSNFECIIVDDCSTIDISPLAAEYSDEKFVFIRNLKNGGPSNARTLGWKSCKGDYIMNIDSDWEPFPWMIERVNFFFQNHPEVDAVTGMHIDQLSSRMFVRVKDQSLKVSPKNKFHLQNGGGDCVTAAKKHVISEYLKRSNEYYASEYHLNLTFMMKYTVLFVDEPWCRLYIDSNNRVTNTFNKNIERWVNDCRLFLQDYKKDLAENPSFKPLTDQFINNTIFLLRNKKWTLARGYITAIKVSHRYSELLILNELVRRTIDKSLRKVKIKKDPETTWL
jgi:glycosyltransferase involved in cell wall biosynthesis